MHKFFWECRPIARVIDCSVIYNVTSCKLFHGVVFLLHFKLLLAAGADFKKMFKSAIYNYFTPVHICASKSKTDCIEVLWKFGACLNIRNGDGLLPKELTPDEKCRELLIRLEGMLIVLTLSVSWYLLFTLVSCNPQIKMNQNDSWANQVLYSVNVLGMQKLNKWYEWYP